MSDDKVKQQRDRFLAFSFASSDLLIEVGGNGEISYALGAARSLTGINEKQIIGHKWFSLFSPSDRIKLSQMKNEARLALRCGPVVVHLHESFGGRQAVVTGIAMPDNDNFYMTIGFTNGQILQSAHQVPANTQQDLLDKENFISIAKEAFDLARSLEQSLDLTLLDIDGVKDIKHRIGEEAWEKFSEAVNDLLNRYSVDGKSAARITEGRYSLVHDRELDTNLLQAELAKLTREYDPQKEGFDIQSKCVTSDLSAISERDAAKALVYTINEFERKGVSLNIDSLNSSFKAYVTANAHKIVQFKAMVEQLNFDLHFQPIVSLKDRKIAHFEMLSRFNDNVSTHEWIAFAEDIGMMADFDIAVCERAINYLLYKSSGRRTAFAINLSGQSIQNEQFFRTLYAKLSLHKELAERIIFEITESSLITDFSMFNHFIQVLRGDGYKICLDDFGVGAGSFESLRKLDIDYVKIDGAYTRKILTSEKDAIMVRNLSQMCGELKIGVIAEMIETEAQANLVMSLGIEYGQGYLFGRPSGKPEYAGAP